MRISLVGKTKATWGEFERDDERIHKYKHMPVSQSEDK